MAGLAVVRLSLWHYLYEDPIKAQGEIQRNAQFELEGSGNLHRLQAFASAVY